MALSIKSDEADRLARELAAETGETLTEAVETALRERLDREHSRQAASMRTRLKRLAADVAALPVADDKTRDGRKQNRRVEVRLFVPELNQSGSTVASAQE